MDRDALGACDDGRCRDGMFRDRTVPHPRGHLKMIDVTLAAATYSVARFKLDTVSVMAAPNSPESGADLNVSDRELGELRSRIRFKVCYDVGFYCPDVD